MVKEKTTLDELSASLNLSRNTIWAFRKKVNQKVLAAGDGQPSWEEMILLYPLPS